MDNPPPPRPRRDHVILAARIVAGAGEWSCRVRNLSPIGACIDNRDAGLQLGERVRVELGAISPVNGAVAWATPNLAGVHFDRSIDPAAVRRTTTDAEKAGWLGRIPNAYRRGR